MKIARIHIMCGIFLCTGITLAFARDIPVRPTGYVTDIAHIIEPQQEIMLEKRLAAFERATSHQIFVATIPSLEGDGIEDFSIRLAEKWRAGTKEEDNGIIIVVAHAERKVRIEVGYGLEGVVPDALAGMIIQNYMVPLFQQGQFGGGIAQGVEALIAHTGQGRATNMEVQPLYGSRIGNVRRNSSNSGGIIMSIFLLLAVILSICDIQRYRAYCYQMRLLRERYTASEWWVRFSWLLAFMKGLLELLWYIMIIAMFSRGGSRGSRGFGGSGFSGGGGGSFGGGGASGGW